MLSFLSIDRLAGYSDSERSLACFYVQTFFTNILCYANILSSLDLWRCLTRLLPGESVLDEPADHGKDFIVDRLHNPLTHWIQVEQTVPGKPVRQITSQLSDISGSRRIPLVQLASLSGELYYSHLLDNK